MLRAKLWAALVGLVLPVAAYAQSADDLKNDARTPGDVLTYGMGYNGQRYSPLATINRDNVKRLVPAWSYSMADNRGLEAQPLVKDGVIYVTDHQKTVAIDALSGKEVWKSPIEYPPETTRVACCGMVNRGAAMFDGKLYRTTLDAYVIALDLKTGKEVWRTKSSDPSEGYSMTAAPLVANGVVVSGVSGGEFGARGYLEGLDAQTGKSLWRTYTIPGPGEPGYDSWPAGSRPAGGATWVTGTYDPELDLVYWGTGNPAPWNPLLRKGDNLYANSVLALQPKTGKVVWSYQMNPNDPFDYDGVNEWIVADLKDASGALRKVVMQANRSGFLYVLDRSNGELVAAHKFVQVNWADRIDLQTGRPVWSEEVKSLIEKGGKARIYPSVGGGKGWPPMSFDPARGLVYVNTIEIGMDYETLPVDRIANLKPGAPHYGVKVPLVFDPEKRGALKAINPMTGEVKWEVPLKTPNYAGTFVTAGGLVVTGQMTGELMAFDADTGKLLWQFQTPSAINGSPITWEKDGKQYITANSGLGGIYATFVSDPRLAHVPAGGTVWTFKLFEDFPQRSASRE